MGYDRGRRGKGRDKRDGFGEEGFDPFMDNSPPAYGGGERWGGGNDRFGGQDRDDRAGGGGGGFRGGGGGGGGFRGGGGGGAPRGGGMPAQVVGTGQGKVKFFNTQKGFGFIQRDEGGEDVFVHISQVERAGLEGLAEGQELQFNLVDRGGKISAADLQVVGDVIPVEQRAPQRQLTGEKATGTVKFFNSMKGFGFITRDDGKEDAFVHISAVERSGLPGINEGDRFEFDLEVDRRGKFSAVNLVPVQG
jgi:CspA family cold shock protein